MDGTPTELAEAVSVGVKPNSLTLRLNVNAGRLLDEYGVRYENTRTHTGRRVTLALVPKEARRRGHTCGWRLPQGIQTEPLDFLPTEHTCRVEGKAVAFPSCPTASDKV